ncbi:MAG: tandem-95 repeat protein, partial [Thermoleophilia bacterium]|nr:tandem-95 repeat protein [Thermoleophilia bacterium]
MEETKRANRWHARRGLAALVRAGVLLGPIVISVAFVWTITRYVELHGSPLWLLIAWWIALSAGATGILIVLDRLVRRALPLAALLQLSLVFPDEAPSRLRTAMGRLTAEELRRELKQAREGRSATPNEAAQRLLRFVSTLTTHDRLTRGHSERVRAYSQMIGVQLRLPEEDIERLNWAALVHDVGKLTVPRDVLNKDGKPTEEEWRALRGHAEEGARLVAPLRPWLGEWCDAVGQHHERWDGKGYPHGLEGNEISLGGRIVAVADVFDVMTSRRSYKPAASIVEARRELTDRAGSQFDPGIVRAFLDISLGRLRAAVGPFSWIANIPVIGQASLSTALGGALGSIAIGSTAFLGILAGGALAQEQRQPGPETAERTITANRPTSPWTNDLRRPVDRLIDLETSTPQGTNDVPGVAESPSEPSSQEPATLEAPDLSPSLTEDTPADIGVGLPNLEKVTSLRITRQPDFGQISVPADDTLRYVPERDFNGRLTSTYEACWSASQCDSGEVTLSVAGVNDEPIATDDEVGTGPAARVIEVVENDRDVDGDDLSITLEGELPRGSVALVDGGVSYTPLPGFAGLDTFGYRVDDGHGGTDTATVRLTVDPGNTPPLAGDDTVTLTEGSVATFDVLANDSDPDGSEVTLAGYDDSGIVNGTLQDNGNGSFTYAPEADFVGTESFAYKVVDDRGGSDGAVVDITVTGVNDAPDFTPGADVTVAADAGAQSIGGWASRISAGPADEAGQSVSFIVSVDDPSLFVVPPTVATDGTLTFSPDPARDGVATITAQPVDDGGTANGGIDTGIAQATTITIDPPANQSQLYVGSSGPSADEWYLWTATPGPADPVPDTDSDGQPGLTIARSSGSDT